MNDAARMDLNDVTVSPEWLSDRLTDNDLVVVDVSWYQAHENREPEAEFLAEHVPGAIYIPLEELADASSPLPHTLPDIDALGTVLGRHGISTQSTVISYDATGFRTSPRLWWLLKWAGHEQVAILDGGLPAWKSAGLALESGATQRRAARFEARTGDHMPTVCADELARSLTDDDRLIVDSRPRGRFDGAAPEPRPGLRSGHIPGSVSAELQCFVDRATNRLLPADALAHRLKELGVDVGRQIVTTCGSGVAATGLIAILQKLGVSATLYDGSWCEWGGRKDLPISQSDLDSM